MRGEGAGRGMQYPHMLRQQHVPHPCLMHGVCRNKRVQEVQQHVFEGDRLCEEIGPPRPRGADKGDRPGTSRRAHGERREGDDEGGEGVRRKDRYPGLN